MGIYGAWNNREVDHPRGVLVTDEPRQKETPSKPIKHKDVVLDTLAEYSLKARVLSTESYWIDRMAKIVPVDVALGWGVMSDSSLIEKLNIYQADRFYFYSWRGDLPVNPDEIVKSSANMHLIPATEYIENEIKKLRKGHLVELKGSLVRVNFSDGSDAMSSLAREDAGAGACEIMWVNFIRIL